MPGIGEGLRTLADEQLRATKCPVPCIARHRADRSLEDLYSSFRLAGRRTFIVTHAQYGLFTCIFDLGGSCQKLSVRDRPGLFRHGSSTVTAHARWDGAGGRGCGDRSDDLAEWCRLVTETLPFGYSQFGTLPAAHEGQRRPRTGGPGAGPTQTSSAGPATHNRRGGIGTFRLGQICRARGERGRQRAHPCANPCTVASAHPARRDSGRKNAAEVRARGRSEERSWAGEQRGSDPLRRPPAAPSRHPALARPVGSLPLCQKVPCSVDRRGQDAQAHH